MPPLRRRHHNNNRSNTPSPSMIFASFGALIFFFVIYSLFALPRHSDVHIHNRQHPRRSTSDSGEGGGLPVFSVPEGGRKSGNDLWKSRDSEFFYGCSNSSSKFAKPKDITRSNRYLLIATSGGLNQQRTGIIDGVVAARILNATLVIPKLDQRSYWKDASAFADIFDVDWFISSLLADVKVIKGLPKGLKPYGMKVPRKCNERCYEKRVLTPLIRRHAVQLNKYDYRLANKLETDLQKLRCRVNYHALKFTDPIHEMGKALVQRMRTKSEHFIALHLRFEPDMLAFSGCYYGGGDKEIKDLGAIRKRWKTLHGANPDKQRRQGRCPLTPEEVGLMLRALGYGSDVHIYVASGDVYGGEDTLAPLKSLFPNFYSKDTIASKEELEPFSKFSARMAALDFIVCDESDVFVTNNNGNMAKILAGRRRYYGHKPTIRPNAKKLSRVFVERQNMTWQEFESKVRTRQRGFMGFPNEVRPGRGEFHENPAACICEDAEARARRGSSSRRFGRGNTPMAKDEEEDSDDHPEEDMDFVEPDYEDLHDGVRNRPNATTTGDYDLTSDETELEDILSD